AGSTSRLRCCNGCATTSPTASAAVACRFGPAGSTTPVTASPKAAPAPAGYSPAEVWSGASSSTFPRWAFSCTIRCASAASGIGRARHRQPSVAHRPERAGLDQRPHRFAYAAHDPRLVLGRTGAQRGRGELATTRQQLTEVELGPPAALQSDDRQPAVRRQRG